MKVLQVFMQGEFDHVYFNQKAILSDIVEFGLDPTYPHKLDDTGHLDKNGQKLNPEEPEPEPEPGDDDGDGEDNPEDP